MVEQRRRRGVGRARVDDRVDRHAGGERGGDREHLGGRAEREAPGAAVLGVDRIVYRGLARGGGQGIGRVLCQGQDVAGTWLNDRGRGSDVSPVHLTARRDLGIDLPLGVRLNLGVERCLDG